MVSPTLGVDPLLSRMTPGVGYIFDFPYSLRQWGWKVSCHHG